MNNLQVPRAKIIPIFLFFCFFLQAHLRVNAISNEPVYTPTDQIFLSCGSSGDTDSYGRSWTGDLKPSGFSLSESPSNKSINASATNQGSSDDVPYMRARLSHSWFMYSFSVSPGKKFLRLHFHPDGYQGFRKSMDFIGVKVGQQVLLKNFSASDYSAVWGTPSFFLEYCVSVGRGEQLNVSFYPFANNSVESYVFINGIEIVSMPDTLYYPPNASTGPRLIGQDKKYNIGNDTVMEKVCRLNVGGYPISQMNDTGMYRRWENDEIYTFPLYGVVPRDPTITLNFSRTPRYIAPEDLYESARSMGRNRLRNEMTNMTWGVPVESGFHHLVRLHFCEFDLQVTQINDRRFVIYIDNQTAEAGFDVLEASGGKQIPIYRDYIVRTGEKIGKRDYYLFIKLHPHPSSVYADAILNGLEVFKLSDADGNFATASNDYDSDTPPPAPAAVGSPPPAQNKCINKVTLYGIIGGEGLFFLLMVFSMCLLLAWNLKKRKNHEYDTDSKSSICSWFMKPSNSKPSREGSSSALPKDICRKFSLSEMNSATNSFHSSMIIGRGGFGYVYRGEIEMDKKGKTVVAIKRSDPESRKRNLQGAKEFKAEIEMLSQLRHANLVSLIGYCNDKGEMILVYEYITNGTLDSHLYGTDKDPIPWRRRLEICIGAARGLHYLHESAVNKIIHRDVKTSNILIDEAWIAKVSDFGLSKIYLEDKAVSTKIRGTRGYIDPEYYNGQGLTEKSDVYSFGVVLLEVLCGRKPVDRTLEEDQMSLVVWAQKCISQGTIHEAIDPYLMGCIAPECFNMFVDIAERCTRKQGLSRPSMRDVMDTLEFALKLQDGADSELLNEVKDDGNGAAGAKRAYPCVPFRAPPVYKLEEIVDDDDDEEDFGPMEIHDQDISTSKSGSYFSGTTSKFSV